MIKEIIMFLGAILEVATYIKIEKAEKKVVRRDMWKLLKNLNREIEGIINSPSQIYSIETRVIN